MPKRAWLRYILLSGAVGLPLAAKLFIADDISPWRALVGGLGSSAIGFGVLYWPYFIYELKAAQRVRALASIFASVIAGLMTAAVYYVVALAIDVGAALGALVSVMYGVFAVAAATDHAVASRGAPQEPPQAPR